MQGGQSRRGIGEAARRARSWGEFSGVRRTGWTRWKLFTP